MFYFFPDHATPISQIGCMMAGLVNSEAPEPEGLVNLGGLKMGDLFLEVLVLEELRIPRETNITKAGTVVAC